MKLLFVCCTLLSALLVQGVAVNGGSHVALRDALVARVESLVLWKRQDNTTGDSGYCETECGSGNDPAGLQAVDACAVGDFACECSKLQALSTTCQTCVLQITGLTPTEMQQICANPLGGAPSGLLSSLTAAAASATSAAAALTSASDSVPAAGATSAAGSNPVSASAAGGASPSGSASGGASPSASASAGGSGTHSGALSDQHVAGGLLAAASVVAGLTLFFA